MASERIENREIYDFCAGNIADFKVPRLIEYRDSLPKSPTGKVLRDQVL